MGKIISDAGVISTNHNLYITTQIFQWYSEYNKESESPKSDISELSRVALLVHQKNGWVYNPSTSTKLKNISIPKITNKNLKTVVLGFSGGLDSVYQAIVLKKRGYDVILYHLKNINSYENGQATKVCKRIADKLGCEYVESVINKKMGAQEVPENPLKNELIMSLMVDYCLDNNIPNISMGDDLNLSIKDSVVGINVTDSYEITESFIGGIRSVIPDITFLPLIGGEKLERIKKLMEYGLENDYYSCVQAGRFNQSLHQKTQEKYGIKLFDNNCGCNCRKCSMHNLLMHYGGVKTFPQEFIDKCWRRMWDNSHSTDYELFKPELDEETRIKNLFNY